LQKINALLDYGYFLFSCILLYPNISSFV
jgi:hypothetical protein